MQTSAGRTRPFSPGERVAETGVYESDHLAQHAHERHLIFEQGKKFPLCNVCFWSVKYYLIGDCAPDDMTPISRKRNEANIRSLSA